MPVEMTFNDKIILIFGLKKIDGPILKKIFEAYKFTQFDELYQEFHFVLSIIMSDGKFTGINLTNQTIFIQSENDYKLTIIGDDINLCVKLNEFFDKNKTLRMDFAEELNRSINIKKQNVYLENENRFIVVDGMKILNMTTLNKLFTLFCLNVGIDRLLITIIIKKEDRIIIRSKFDNSQNWSISDELTYILRIDSQEGYSALLINDFFSENLNMTLHYDDNDNEEDDNPNNPFNDASTFTVYDETEKFSFELVGLSLVNFEVIRKFMYEKLRIINIMSVNFMFTKTNRITNVLKQMNIYENTYLENNNDYKLVIIVDKEAPVILHDRIEAYMFRNNNSSVYFISDDIDMSSSTQTVKEVLHLNNKKEIDIRPLTNTMKSKDLEKINPTLLLDEDFVTLFGIYKSKPDMFDIFNKFITKPKCHNPIQFFEDYQDENITNIFTEFISCIGCDMDREFAQSLLKKHNYHLNLVLRDLLGE